MSDAAAQRKLSVSRAAAFSLAALAMLVPANLLPVMRVHSLGKTPTEASILSGVQLLMDGGLWGLAAIVFTASIVVPLLKLIGIARLMWAVRHGADRAQAPRLTRLYAALDFIGRWSMLDVFLVAFLAGAVRFGRLAQVEPLPGIVAFAAAVVFTMLATHAFDPHLLWSGPPEKTSHGKSPAA